MCVCGYRPHPAGFERALRRLKKIPGAARAVVTSHSLAMAPSDSISGTLSQSDRVVDGVDDLRCTTRYRFSCPSPSRR